MSATAIASPGQGPAQWTGTFSPPLSGEIVPLHFTAPVRWAAIGQTCLVTRNLDDGTEQIIGWYRIKGIRDNGTTLLLTDQL